MRFLESPEYDLLTTSIYHTLSSVPTVMNEKLWVLGASVIALIKIANYMYRLFARLITQYQSNDWI